MKKLLDWLDHRSGYRSVMAAALTEQVPGGASFAYVFGSVLTFILVLQMTTGVFLAMYYSPSATDAWASVAYIQDTVTWGWFVRGLHSNGASAMVIVSGLHLMQTALYGAYKKPRELNWIAGVLMLGLILAFALTGYLLPWDQTGYWATKVATGIAGTTPLVGEALQSLIQGGNEYGNLTLTRFFAIHVFVLPALLIGLVVVHIALFRRHGVTPRWGRSDQELARTTQPFWPNQLFKDVVAMAAVFAVMIGINLYTHGAKLDGPADPASNFDARPEWYFRALFQMLKYFEGAMEHVVALGAPVVAGVILLGLPFADRGPDRSPRARIKFLAVLGAGALVAGLLTAISFREDAANEQLQERLAQAEEDATKARALARQYGVPPAGGTAVYTTEPFYRARTLWAEHCESCHQGDEREAPEIGPGYNARQWIAAFLKNPGGSRFFGKTEIEGMDPVELTGNDFDAVVELVYAQTGAADVDAKLVERGKALFDGDGECSGCHEIDGTSEGDGPNLGGRGSLDMLAAFIADAGEPRFFGERNEMPSFGRDKLSEDERYALAEYLIWMRDQTPARPWTVDDADSANAQDSGADAKGGEGAEGGENGEDVEGAKDGEDTEDSEDADSADAGKAAE